MKRKAVFLALCTAMAMTVSAGSVYASEIPQAVESSVDAVGAGQITLGVSSGQDITAALRNAIKESASTIVIPAGSYSMTEQVGLNSDVTIIANGATIKASNNMESMIHTVASASHANISIQGGIWDGAGKVSSAVIRIQNTNGYKVSGVTIKGSSGSAMVINSSQNVSVENATLDGNGEYGINAKSSTVSVTGISANSNGKAGFFAQASAKMDLTNCVASSNTEKGIYYLKSSGTLVKTGVNSNKAEGISISGSKLTMKNFTATNNANDGITCREGSTVTLSGASISGNKGHGIQISAKGKMTINQEAGAVNITKNNWNGISMVDEKSTLTVDGGSYTGNGVKPKASSEGESGHGIGVFKGSSATISNADCSGNKICGISLFNEKTNVTIKGCKADNNGSHGIGIRKGVTASISNTQVNGNKENGIMDNDNCNITVQDCTVCGSKLNGISVGKSSTAVIKNTNVSTSKLEGIYVSESSKATITGGSSSSNSKNGVATNNKGQIKVSGMIIEKNKMYGVNIKGGTADVQKCTIKKNKQSGVQVKKSDKGKKEAAKVSNLSNNKITDNGQYGVYVNASTISKMQKNTISGHTKSGISLYRKATAKNIKNNKLNNTKFKEVYVESGSKSNISTVNAVKINTAKKNAKKIKGVTVGKSTVTVKVNGKTYNGTAAGSGKYNIKTDKLVKGESITVSAKDKAGNTYSNSISVK